MIEGRAGKVAIYVAATLAALAWLLPYAWMVSTSFKTLGEILARPADPLPAHPSVEGYREVFRAISVGRYALVTGAMATSIAALQVVLALPAGYALAKLRFVGRPFAAAAVLACLFVPAQASFVPVFLLFARLHWVDTMGALVLPFAASALGTLLVRQALQSVPDELVEAARMDGASEWTIIYRILAPTLTPTLISLFLVSFVFHYNDYFWPLVMTTDDSVRTLPLAIALLREQGTGVRWHIVMAGNVVLSLPILMLFAVLQRHLVRAVGLR